MLLKLAGFKVLPAVGLNMHLSIDQFCLKIWGHLILISKQKQRCYRVECKIDKMSLKVGLDKKLHIVGGAFWAVEGPTCGLCSCDPSQTSWGLVHSSCIRRT